MRKICNGNIFDVHMSKEDRKIELDNLYDTIKFYSKYAMTKKDKNKLEATVDLDTFMEIFDIGLAEYKFFYNHFGFVVPTKKDMLKNKNFVGSDTVLEVFAGLGLFAKLLLLESVNVIPTDNFAEFRLLKFALSLI